MNGRCLDCGKLVPELSQESLEAAGWGYFGQISASGFPRHNWRCSDCVESSLKELLERARQEVQPIIDREREGEHVPQGLMEFRMR